MSTREYVRSLDALQGLEAELSQFNHGADTALADAGQSAKAAEKRLTERSNYWRSELRRRESALATCERDDRRSCRSEEAAVQEAKQAVEKMSRLSKQLAQAIGEYTHAANRCRRKLTSEVASAKSDLAKVIQRYRNYITEAKAEAAITRRLHKMGYNQVFPLQYDGLHGIDLGAIKGTWKAPTAAAVVEVKGRTDRYATPSEWKDQVRGSYWRPRLSQAKKAGIKGADGIYRLGKRDKAKISSFVGLYSSSSQGRGSTKILRIPRRGRLPRSH